MRKKLRSLLFDEFLRRSSELGFESIKSPTAHWCRVRKTSPTGISFFIELGTNEDKDRFVVDIAWSPNPSYPVAQLVSLDEEEVPDGASIRLTILAEPDRRMHLAYEFEEPKPLEWYETATLEEMIAPPPTIEELIPKIPVFLDEVFQQLREYGLPYFERVDQKYGSD